jgi:hypothetical protein
MPFFTPFKNNEEFSINYDIYQRVAVYYYTSSESEVTPLKFKYETKDCSIETVEINQILVRNEKDKVYRFTCSCTNYGRSQQVNLIFYSKQSIWVMRKF